MKKDKSYDRWLETGYELLAREGPESLQVERLARIVGLNKSGFYHYFGTREGFLKELMKMHVAVALPLANDIEKGKTIVPGLIQVLQDYATPVFVHMQLIRNPTHNILREAFDQVNDVVDPVLIRLWAEFIGFPHNLSLAERHYLQIRDMFYSRISLENMHYDYLEAMFLEAKEVVLELLKMNALDGPV